MKNIEIRTATQDDAIHISILGKITFTETFGHLFKDPSDLQHYLETTFSVTKIDAGLRKMTAIFWLAFANGQPVGYAKLKLNSTTSFTHFKAVCQLQKIYVKKDFLSFKIGHKLQDQLLLKATELHYNYIWLSVLNSNERAIRFYKKNGFDIIGNHDFTIGKEHFDFFAMGKKLM
ncbi:GNAT family N-acetyltransferase [uncultured Dokdonia sp.]|uniref:GNAT family N-acetyltransferase n=1 Tax=uncultured Dokdonia sp. TaxID=575653 RepID=UPI002626C7A0|nr:GNAT family N-acetyltransferase [uncultured Dokdonia sp.]